MITIGQAGTLSWAVYLAGFVVIYILTPREWRLPLLLTVSVLYYVWGRPVDILLIAALGVGTYYVGVQVRRAA